MQVKELQEKLSANAFRMLSYAAEHRNDFVCSASGFESKAFRASLAELGTLGYVEEIPEPKPRHPYHVPQAPQVPFNPKGLKARDILTRFLQEGVPLCECIIKPLKLTKRTFAKRDISSRWEGACCDESGKPWVTNGYFLFRSTKKEWAQFGLRQKNGDGPLPRTITNITKQPEKTTLLRPYRANNTGVWLKADNGLRDCKISIEIYRLVLHRYPRAVWSGGLYIPYGQKVQTWDYIYIHVKGKLVGVCTAMRD